MDSPLRARASGDDGSDLSEFKMYYYHPSLPAAAIFTAVFGLLTLAHAYQMVRTRTWFMIPFVIGGIMETVGYIGRLLSSEEAPDYSLGPYVMQTLLILIAPALFAASIYMELGRIVEMIRADDALFVPRKWLTKIFVAGDILAFVMQGAGGALLASGSGGQDTGEKVVVGGLFVQIVFFGVFVLAAIVFKIRQSRRPSALANERPWNKHMTSLYIVSILIFARSIVRVVEYLQGYSGYILSHEAFIYCFDALPMTAAVVTMNFIHPGEVAYFVRGMRREEKAREEQVPMAGLQAA